ncbi:MAG: methionyl-tRNA formyltransferase [Flavobacteriaceae bacterium]|jgi:methionyl-tRNA formyltransferase|nr:methionyl-tRNA formyltransferase [Flavobacteriaceae bacterium]MDG1831450.1 methionyl-tRNA formyltransferase [Flavobacteriaceae bacterium]
MNNLKIIFMGSSDFAVKSLDNLLLNNYDIKAVVTAPDKKSGRGKKINFSDVKKYSLKKNLKLLQPENLKQVDFVNKIKSFNADIIIVVAFRMLPKIVWEIPNKGTINLHASLLPQLRGAAPIHWAIINGLKKTGVTTFFINQKIDFGNIIEQKEVKIEDFENTGSLYEKLKIIGGLLILSTLKLISENNLKTIKQSNSLNLIKAPKLNKENRKIDWNKSGFEIFNLIRGLSPFPSAWTKDKKNNKIIKLFNVIYHKEIKTKHLNGVISIKNNMLKILLKDGYLEVLEIQIEGKKRMSGKEFINGYREYDSIRLL